MYFPSQRKQIRHPFFVYEKCWSGSWPIVAVRLSNGICGHRLQLTEEGKVADPFILIMGIDILENLLHHESDNFKISITGHQVIGCIKIMIVDILKIGQK